MDSLNRGRHKLAQDEERARQQCGVEIRARRLPVVPAGE